MFRETRRVAVRGVVARACVRPACMHAVIPLSARQRKVDGRRWIARCAAGRTRWYDASARSIAVPRVTVMVPSPIGYGGFGGTPVFRVVSGEDAHTRSPSRTSVVDAQSTRGGCRLHEPISRRRCERRSGIRGREVRPGARGLLPRHEPIVHVDCNRQRRIGTLGAKTRSGGASRSRGSLRYSTALRWLVPWRIRVALEARPRPPVDLPAAASHEVAQEEGTGSPQPREMYPCADCDLLGTSRACAATAGCIRGLDR